MIPDCHHPIYTFNTSGRQTHWHTTWLHNEKSGTNIGSKLTSCKDTPCMSVRPHLIHTINIQNDQTRALGSTKTIHSKDNTPTHVLSPKVDITPGAFSGQRYFVPHQANLGARPPVYTCLPTCLHRLEDIDTRWFRRHPCTNVRRSWSAPHIHTSVTVARRWNDVACARLAAKKAAM